MQNAQLTGSLATALFEQLVDSIEEAVDDNRQISHSEVARRTVSRLDSLGRPQVHRHRTRDQEK